MAKKDVDVQLTLPECMETELEANPKRLFTTSCFSLIASEKALEALDDKTAGKSEDTQRRIRMAWIQERMRASKDSSPIPGGEWEGSRAAIYEKLFGKDCGPKMVP